MSCVPLGSPFTSLGFYEKPAELGRGCMERDGGPSMVLTKTRAWIRSWCAYKLCTSSGPSGAPSEHSHSVFRFSSPWSLGGATWSQKTPSRVYSKPLKPPFRTERKESQRLTTGGWAASKGQNLGDNRLGSPKKLSHLSLAKGYLLGLL